jgi:chorismate dehydratase
MTSPPLRVGSVPYLVARPLDMGLGDEPGIELSYLVPAELVARLRDGELDVALVSSIELFRQPGYRYLPGLAVAGEGAVSSVQVFLRKPIEQVRTLALDPASRTAATLVRVLLAERPGGAPEFREVRAGEDPRRTSDDAWLRIGDPALREFLAPDAPPVFNPSQAWYERTGLPFVFAAWIVRPGAQVEPHLEAFLAARRRGAAALESLIKQASDDWSLPRDACDTYLRGECLYEPAATMRTALFAFRDAASQLGLCESGLEPEPIGMGDAQRRVLQEGRHA